MLTERLLRAMWPKGDSASPGLVAAMAAAAPTVFQKHGLTSELLVAHAIAQFQVECGSGTEMTENINYTPERACQVWPKRFTNADDCLQKVGSFAGDPDFKIKLMDSVYGSRNGNVPGTHDGSTFIGRGLSQLTGRGNYDKLGHQLGLDLVSNPDLVNVPANALECGVADFVMCGCLPLAAQNDVLAVSAMLNVGHLVANPAAVEGFAERKAALRLWKIVLGVDVPPLHSDTWVQLALDRLGADPALVPDGVFGQKSQTALKGFQTVHGLPADGQRTPQTLAAIDAALVAVPAT
jgi:putative chitinase